MESIQEKIDELLEREGIPACSILVADKHGELWRASFGDADLETQFHYFSGTKLYTANAILKLADQHKLRLSDDVSKHLPEMGDLEGITIQHLLCHSSGLTDTLSAFVSANFQSTSKPSTLQALNKYNIKRARAPGKLSSYANVNYAILGLVIEKVGGKSYSDFITEQVLKPLGSNACFSFRDATDLTTGRIGYWNSILPVVKSVATLVR